MSLDVLGGRGALPYALVLSARIREAASMIPGSVLPHDRAERMIISASGRSWSGLTGRPFDLVVAESVCNPYLGASALATAEDVHAV